MWRNSARSASADDWATLGAAVAATVNSAAANRFENVFMEPKFSEC
jgi:hypothetical protein